MSAKPFSWAAMAAANAEKPVTELPGVHKVFSKEDIIIKKDSWTEKAKEKLRANKTLYPTEQATVCFMWTRKGDVRFALSGGSEYQSLTPDKVTVCAEDNLLRRFHDDKKNFAWSAAYDNKNGWKKACQKGCSKLLSEAQIEDIASSMKEEEKTEED